jgi:hypothetical protein
MTATTIRDTVSGGRPAWRRLLDFNLFTGIVLAAVGGLVGDLIGTAIHAPSISYYGAEAGANDISVLLAYLFGTIGFSATRPRSRSTSPRARGSGATSACAPTTRWSRSSTSSASGSSS